MATDYKYTRYQPDYGELDYEQRYVVSEPAPESVSKTPLQRKMEQEDLAARQDRAVRRRIADPATVVPAYLAQGVHEDMASMRAAMSRGDIVAAQGFRDKISKFAEEHNPALVSWSVGGGTSGGDLSKTMSAMASSILDETYLDNLEIPYGQGGKITARDFFANSTPEAKDRAAMLFSQRNGVSKDAARILTDQDSEYHSFFGSMLDDAASGRKLQMADATRLAGDDKLAQAESAMKLYAEDLVQSLGSGAWDGIDKPDQEAFYRGCYSYFGDQLSKGQLQTLRRVYANDTQKSSFNASTWFQARSSALETNAPKMTQLIPKGKDAQGNVQYETTQIKVPGVSPYAVLDASLQAYEKLQERGMDMATTDVESATGQALTRQYRLERNFGFRFSDYGASTAASGDALYNLTNRTYDEPDGQVLSRAERWGARVERSLGYAASGTSSSTSHSGLAMEKSVKTAAMKAFMEHRDDPDGGDLEVALAGSLEDVVRDFSGRDLWMTGDKALSDGAVRALAGRIAQNIFNGTSQNVETMLLDLSGRLKVDPQTGEASLQAREAFLDPTTGNPVKQMTPPDAGADLGFLATNNEAWKSMPAEKRAALWGPDGTLGRMASGTLPEMKDRPESGAVSELTRWVRQIQDASLARGVSDQEYMGAQKPAGGVLWANMTDGLKIPDDIPALKEFVTSGDVFRFLEGRDKELGTTAGDGALRDKGVSAMNSIAARLSRDGRSPEGERLSPQARAALAEIAARIGAEVLNRGRFSHNRQNFSETAGQLLRQLGFIKEIQSSRFGYWLGSIEDLTGTARLDELDDAEARSTFAKARANIASLYGVSAPPEGSWLRHLGYDDHSDTDLGSGSYSRSDYGMLLRNWTARRMVAPPLRSTTEEARADSTIGANTSAVSAKPVAGAVEPPFRDYKGEFDRMMSYMLTTEEGLDTAKMRAMSYLEQQASVDPEMAKSVMGYVLPEIDRVYRTDGYTAAMDYIESNLMNRRLVYTSSVVPGSAGGPQAVYMPKLMTGEDYERLRANLAGERKNDRVTDSDIAAWSYLNRQGYLRQQKLQDRLAVINAQNEAGE